MRIHINGISKWEGACGRSPKIMGNRYRRWGFPSLSPLLQKELNAQSDFSFVAQTKDSGIPEAESSSTSWPLPAFPPLSPVTLALGLCSNHVELLSVYLKPPTLTWASGAWNANLAPLISHYRPVPTNLSAKMSLTQMDLSRVTSSGSRTLNAVHKLRRKKKKKDACSLEEKLWQT